MGRLGGDGSEQEKTKGKEKGRMDRTRGEGRGFSEVSNSNCKYALHCQFAPPCQISCRSVKPYPRYGRLLNFSRWLPSAILDFQKLEVLTARTLWRAKMRHRAEFCADRSNCCRDMAVYNFQDGGRPPSWILKGTKF